ncbi:PREDICTED: lipase 3-like [Vollenhovia emeryi]|uniref:lipase 3-like n=1 Tax=Vollenhovia emeryi TaxID=411798 RepID=UPI0005F48B72|nr:PREDICTED: lipase 3-like [Vollenhovia emeryi]
MLLLMYLVGILASTNAEDLTNSIEKIPKLNPTDKIQHIPELLTLASPDDATLTTMELISKYGYKGELHKVTTADGYILELHRIKGRTDNSTDLKVQKPVALVMHGLLCDSSTWVLAGREKSLGFILADEGYDVWLGNARGTTYARNHKSRKTLKSKKDFWNFSWHEIGTRDLPAMIDYIVKTTGRQKMFYLGHSQGTTAFFVMASERPEYQKYIEEMYAMAPIAYCGRMKSPFMQLLAQFTLTMEIMGQLFGIYEFNPTNDFIKAVQRLVCAEKAITQPICSNVMFLVAGFNEEQFDPALLPIILGHVPASNSLKQLVHYGQLIKSGTLFLPGRFKHFDYGLFGNKDLYGTLTPPNYNLTKITAPIHVYYSENDWLANVQDVEKLYSELGNPSGKTLVADKKFNHLDYLWAKDANKIVYEPIISAMKKKST